MIEIHKTELEIGEVENGLGSVQGIMRDLRDSKEFSGLAYCTKYEDGVATVYSTEPIEIVDSTISDGSPSANEDELTYTQIKIYQDICDSFGTETWTAIDVLEATDVSDSVDTMRCTASTLREHGWAEQVHRTDNGSKTYRLTEP